MHNNALVHANNLESLAMWKNMIFKKETTKPYRPSLHVEGKGGIRRDVQGRVDFVKYPIPISAHLLYFQYDSVQNLCINNKGLL